MKALRMLRMHYVPCKYEITKLEPKKESFVDDKNIHFQFRNFVFSDDKKPMLFLHRLTKLGSKIRMHRNRIYILQYIHFCFRNFVNSYARNLVFIYLFII